MSSGIRDLANEVVRTILDKAEWLPCSQFPDLIDGLPQEVTHCAVVTVAGHRLRCFQLADGQRIFDLDDVEAMFSGARVAE